MPIDLKSELIDYLNQRQRKVSKLREEGLEVESQLDSERNFMG